uniref:Uncharacterized protein n=1 Tax=Lepeophtheirus salmonis TaxID=72036 RepID=A0A0K2UA75_LEPSM
MRILICQIYGDLLNSHEDLLHNNICSLSPRYIPKFVAILPVYPFSLCLSLSFLNPMI